jgi:hypothetical protein
MLIGARGSFAMMNTVRVFDFDIDIYGAYVVIRKEPICPGCASDGEVDIEIKRLKDDLDAVAERMKKAIREQAKRPFL